MVDNVDKITSKILEDAEAKSAEIIEQARAESRGKLEASRRKGEAARDRLVSDAEKTSDQTRKKIVAESNIKARTIILESKERLINLAFDQAESELEKIAAGKGYAGVLTALTRDTCVELGGGELEVIVRSADEKTVSKAVKTIEKEVKAATGVDTKISVSTAAIGPGVIVKGGGGKFEIDSTFKNRLELLRPSLRLKVAEALFS
ncbi:MAG: V-type ATP synthase subunit E [Candidatus Hydrothermarchaeales archaeon]